jgi:hypothetical protein
MKTVDQSKTIFALRQGEPTRRWHMIALFLYLLVWGIWSLVGVASFLLVESSFSDIGLLEYYFFLSIPILILISTCLLYIRNTYLIIPFLLLPLAYYLCALRLWPEALDLTNHSIDIHYFMLIPWEFRFGMIFFSGCCIYYLLLRKHDLIK